MNPYIISKIKEEYLTISDTYKLIADTILDYEDNEFTLTIEQLSKKAYCAPSTIIKFINILGFNSYKVFKYELNSIHDETQLNKNIVESFNLVNEYFISHSEITKRFIKDIVNYEKVYIFASGTSKIHAIDFSVKANKIYNNKFIFEYETRVQQMLASNIQKNSLVIFISNSGKSKELSNFYKLLSNKNIYLITNRGSSILSKQIKNTINLNNHFESEKRFKEFSKESKYSLLFFFDKVLEELLNMFLM